MEEKKEIKMSLFSFYVLIAGVVALIAAILIAGFAIIKSNNLETDTGNNLNTGKETANNTIQTNTNQQNGNNSSNVTNNNISDIGGTENTYITEKEKAMNRLFVSNNSELDVNKLSSIIDTTKKVSSVNNYASTMKWRTYNMDDITFQYPSDWRIDQIADDSEEFRIVGTAVGKNNEGTQVVATDVILVVYKPIDCNKSDELTIFADWTGGAMDVTSEKGGLFWNINTVYGSSLMAYDHYAFYQDEQGNNKLARVRFIYPRSEITTVKTTNIENHFLNEFRTK